MASFLGHHPLHTILRSSNFPCSQKPKHFRCIVSYAELPARDRVIDFGKYKGRMLGTLPSTYLKWVSSNLRARDFEEWAKLADQVLEDPVYNDRVEWEHADKLLNGNVLAANSKSVDTVAELLEISKRFGWDNEDKLAWSRIDYQLLGTSKGGRIPRIKEDQERKSVNMTKDGEGWKGHTSRSGSKEVGVTGKRVERRQRLRMKKGMPNVDKNSRLYNVGEDGGRKYQNSAIGSSDDHTAEVYNPFPGRETLLRKVLNRRSIT